MPGLKVQFDTGRILAGVGTVTNSVSSPADILIPGQGTGVFADIVSIIFTNASSTPTTITLSDGFAVMKISLAGNGGVAISFPTPLPASSSNTAWTVSNSAAVSVNCIAIFLRSGGG